MTAVVSLLLILFVALCATILSAFRADIMDSLYGFFHEGPDKSVGLFVSLVTAVVTLLYPAVTQNRRRKRAVVRFRWAEQYLIEKQKMQTREILEYHAQHHWDVYAVASISALLIVVSVIFTSPGTENWPHDVWVIVDVSLFLLAISSIALAYVDLVHTNTLSPLVTTRKRFAMVNMIIIVGSISIAFQLSAISALLALISTWLSIVVSFVAITLSVYFTHLRAIPLQELQDQRKLSDDETEELRCA